jgi:hypothetical protein
MTLKEAIESCFEARKAELKGDELMAFRELIVTDNALIDAMKVSLKTSAGALGQFKGNGSGNDAEAMYDTLLLYWSAVKEAFTPAILFLEHKNTAALGPLVATSCAADSELDHGSLPEDGAPPDRRRSGHCQAASTRTISLSSIAVTRNTSISLIAAPSRAFTRMSSICTAPLAGTR